MSHNIYKGSGNGSGGERRKVVERERGEKKVGERDREREIRDKCKEWERRWEKVRREGERDKGRRNESGREEKSGRERKREREERSGRERERERETGRA